MLLQYVSFVCPVLLNKAVAVVVLLSLEPLLERRAISAQWHTRERRTGKLVGGRPADVAGADGLWYQPAFYGGRVARANKHGATLLARARACVLLFALFAGTHAQRFGFRDGANLVRMLLVFVALLPSTFLSQSVQTYLPGCGGSGRAATSIVPGCVAVSVSSSSAGIFSVFWFFSPCSLFYG